MCAAAASVRNFVVPFAAAMRDYVSVLHRCDWLRCAITKFQAVVAVPITPEKNERQNVRAVEESGDGDRFNEHNSHKFCYIGKTTYGCARA